MTRHELEAALVEWREAERQLTNSSNGDRDRLQNAVDAARDRFQQLSADYMLERIDALHDAEQRRAVEQPSTPDYHEAAQEEKEIAREIFDVARQNDEDTPDIQRQN